MMPQELWLSWLGEGKACECRSWRSWACNSLAHLRITTRATKRCWKTGDIQSRQRRNTHLDALGSWHPEGEKAGTQENAKVLLCITGLLRYRSTWAWKPWCGPLQPTWHTWQKWDQSVLVRPFTTPFRQLGWKTKFIHKSISEVLWKHVHLGFHPWVIEDFANFGPTFAVGKAHRSKPSNFFHALSTAAPSLVLFSWNAEDKARNNGRRGNVESQETDSPIVTV